MLDRANARIKENLYAQLGWRHKIKKKLGTYLNMYIYSHICILYTHAINKTHPTIPLIGIIME